MLRKNILKKKDILLILIISIVASSFYIALNLVSLNMINASKNYYKDINLMDLKLTSSIGFSVNDKIEIEKIKEVNGIMLSKSLSINANIKDKDYKVRVNSISKNRSKKDKNYINRLTLKQGKYPSTINEGLVEEKLIEDANIKIGDLITLIPDNINDLRAKKIKIVGIVKNSFVFSNDYNIYIEENDFNIPYYSLGYVTLKNTNNYDIYSKEYKDYINENKKEILNIIKDSTKNKYNYQTSDLNEKINELEDSLNILYSSLVPQEQLNESIKELSKELDDKKNTLNNILLPSSNVLRKDELSSLNKYQLEIKNIKIITNVFSILFILLQILFTFSMSLNLLNKIHNLEDNNYSSIKIILIYIFYILFFNILGFIIGSLLFYKIILKIIANYYYLIYEIPISISYYKKAYILKSFIYNILSILLSSLLIYLCRIFKDKKIVFKNINFLKNKLNNLNKIVLKSILNQKRKIIISSSLVAVFASSILLLFGIKSSINYTAFKQYKKTYKYNMILNVNYNTYENLNSIKKIVDKDKNSKILFLNDISINAKKNNKSTSAKLNIIKDYNQLNNFIEFKNKKISKNSIIISEKLSKKLEVKKNDYIILKVNKKEYKVKVTNIISDYSNNLVYISNDKYSKLIKENTFYNTFLVISKNNKIINDLKEENNVLSYEMINTQKENFINSTYSLINLILIITVFLSLFFTIIYYDMISKDFALRKKDIYKIKQEGFYDKEILKYYYKKIIITSTLGSFISFIIGSILTSCIINKLNIYSLHISLLSYLSTFIITTVLISIIYILVYFKKLIKQIK